MVNVGLLVLLIVKFCCCCRREGVFMHVNCCRREELAKQVDRLAQILRSTVRLDLRLRQHRPLPTPHRQQRPYPHCRLVLHRHRLDGLAQGLKTTRRVRRRDLGRGRGSGQISVDGVRRSRGRRSGGLPVVAETLYGRIFVAGGRPSGY